MIQPSVGRVVHFYLWNVVSRAHEGPLAALVAHVHSSSMVNVLVVSANGGAYAQTSVLLVQPDEAPPPAGSYCRWMDYQIGQAAKAEQLQAQLAAQGHQPGGGS